MTSERVYDLTILGATGFTGQYIVEEALRECVSNQTQHHICVAGRSRQRLVAGLEKAGQICGVSTESVGIEVVDVSDSEGLEALASKTKVLLSCVGPYRHFGYQVAEACVSGGADYLDISGEPQYLEAVQAGLGDLAAQRGVHMVGSCGFDSVPADMGTVFLQDNFPGTVSHVEMVMAPESSTGSECSVHATTLQCAVEGYAGKSQLRKNRSKIMAEDLPLSQYKPINRPKLWKDHNTNKWCVANIGSDRSVVARSQHLLYKLEKREPLRFTAYFGMHSLAQALHTLMCGLIMMVMSCTVFTRQLLIKFPYVLSLGLFSWQGPTREELQQQSFTMTLTGTGWDLEDPRDGPPNTVRHCKVSGPDPGYVGTAIIVVQCALTMLTEKSSLPQSGGVLTPAAAFLKTSLISRLQQRGIIFSVMQE